MCSELKCSVKPWVVNRPLGLSQALTACRAGMSPSSGIAALGGEHAPALQLPVLVLLQQHEHWQAGERGVAGEDSDDARASFDNCAAKRTSRCDVDPLEQVGASDLAPVVLGEVAESQHFILGLVHQRSGLGEALHQRGLALTVAHLEAQQLPAPFLVHPLATTTAREQTC